LLESTAGIPLGAAAMGWGFRFLTKRSEDNEFVMNRTTRIALGATFGCWSARARVVPWWRR